MSTPIISSRTIPATYHLDTTAVRVDISANNWRSVSLQATLTNSSTPPTLDRPVDIYYLVTDIDLGATPTVSTIQPGGHFTINTSDVASGTRTSTSNNILVGGKYVYVWVKNDILINTVTLDVVVNGSQLSAVNTDAVTVGGGALESGTDLDGLDVTTNLYLKDNALYLRGSTGLDHNHGIKYNSNLDGAAIFGLAGVSLGLAGAEPVVKVIEDTVNINGVLNSTGAITAAGGLSTGGYIQILDIGGTVPPLLNLTGTWSDSSGSEDGPYSGLLLNILGDGPVGPDDNNYLINLQKDGNTQFSVTLAGVTTVAGNASISGTLNVGGAVGATTLHADNGASGTFTAGAKTITVVDGIITSIV